MKFIDSSFLIAVFIEKDQWHSNARKIAEKIIDSKKVTSDLVIAETMATMGALKGGKIAKKTYDYIKDNYIIHITDMDDINSSMNILLKYDGVLSLADSASIHIMKEMKINEIVSFDSDFDKVDKVVRIH